MSLKYVLLTLLDLKPRTGYDLVRNFDSAVGYFWNASHQQVYRELSSLSDAKLLKFKQVKQDDKPDKKIYSLSSSGKLALQTWLESPLKAQKTKDLLLVKLLNTNSDNVDLMKKELEVNIKNSSELQQTYLEIEKLHFSPTQRRSLPTAQLMVYVALRKGILGTGAHLEWLNEVEKLISKNFSS